MRADTWSRAAGGAQQGRRHAGPRHRASGSVGVLGCACCCVLSAAALVKCGVTSFAAPPGPPRTDAGSGMGGMRAAPLGSTIARSAAVGGGSSPSPHGAASVLVGMSFALAAAAAFGQQRKALPRRRTAVAAVEVAPTTLPKVDRSTTKAFRKDLMRSDQYFRFGKTQMQTAMADLKNISGSEIITQLRMNGFRLTIGDVTLVLAESYGFCWGVERAVAMAYEARNFFPDKNIWATNEIIHNPLVNKALMEKGVNFIQVMPDGSKDYSGVGEGDVVILPAFGASVDEMAFLKERKVQIVDTTCPWVSKVWNATEKSKDKGHTVIIHGKYNHEETIATMSFSDKYIVVKNMDEAEYLAEYILGNGDAGELLSKFKNAIPEGFDPAADLERIGVANQTTMLKGETELIGKLFERVMIKKYGPQEINKHFIAFNTICDATQERQDAMYKMFDAEYEAPTSKLYTDLESEQGDVELKSEKESLKLSSRKLEDLTRGAAAVAENAESAAPLRIDLCLVVGGFNSSNTTHLLEIAEEEGVPGYHIDCADRIVGSRIEYKPLSTTPAQAMLDQGLEIKDGFLPDGPVTIGVTSGASTPDSVVGACLERILALRSN